MAIHYPFRSVEKVVGAYESGWHSMFVSPTVQGTTNIVSQMSLMAFQPSRMSRPGNLGTAYIGAWTGNVSSAPLDQHVPIMFKRVNSLVAEVRRVVRNNLLRR